MAGTEETGTIQLRGTRAIGLREAIDSAIKQLALLLQLESSSIVGVRKTEDGWHVTIEFVERKAVPDTQDLLGTYEVSLDSYGELTGYERTDMRRRMDLVEAVE